MGKRHNLRFTGIFSILLGLLGIGTSACFPVVMYGTPQADFSIKGKVLDEEGQPVKGIQVVVANRFENSPSVIYDQNWSPIDTLYTDGAGNYEMTREIFPTSNVQVDIHDVDGTQNSGEFEDETLIFREIEYKDGKGWYSGHAEITVPDIVLKKKSNE